MTDDHREIPQGVFEHLTPEDFSRESSSMDDSAHHSQGADAFNAFTEEQIRMVRAAYIAAERQQLNPIAILVSPSVQRVFTPYDEETLGGFVDRVSRDAKAIGAMWTFVAKKTLVGVASLGSAERETGGATDVDDPAEVAAAMAAGILGVGVLWYAERSEGDERHHRAGTMADTGGRLGEMTEGPSTQAIPLFAQILG